MKTWKIILSAFLCMVLICQVGMPVFASGKPSLGPAEYFRENQGTTEVSLEGPNKSRPVITHITKDMQVKPGEQFELDAKLEGEPPTSTTWTLSRDGGSSYNEVVGNTLKIVTKMDKNFPPEKPYLYKLKVENDSGFDEDIVRVFVSDTKEYDYKKLEANGVTVEGLIHNSIQGQGLVVIEEESSKYPQLEGLIEDGKMALRTYEVRIEGKDGKHFPYIGTLDITFPVGKVFDSHVMRVLHKRADNGTEALQGEVQDGRLKVSTDSLSPFMIEASADKVHRVEVKVKGRGTVAPGGTVYVPKYESQSFVMTGEVGYEIKGVKLDGKSVSYSGNTYTLTNVNQDHELEVTFGKPAPEEDKPNNPEDKPNDQGDDPNNPNVENLEQNGVFYEIQVMTRGNGSVSPSGRVSVRRGDSKTFYFYPQRGYKVGRVLVNGVDMTVFGSSYTFTAVTSHAKLEVIFTKQTDSNKQREQTITATAGKGGSVSPEGATTVPYGGDMYVYFQPDFGYRVSKVTVDGKETETGDSYHFVNVTADRSIHVEFEEDDLVSAKSAKRYEIKTSVFGGNGTVSPEGSTWVYEGGSQTINFYPAEGYEVSAITINGKNVGVDTKSYTLENIREDKDVVVAFAKGNAMTLNSGGPLWWFILLLIVVLSLFVGRKVYVKYREKKNREGKEEKESDS